MQQSIIVWVCFTTKRVCSMNPWQLTKRHRNLTPTMIESLVGQGAILNKKGKSDEAVSVFKKAIDINPHYAEAYEGLGLVYIHKKQEEDATKAFHKAIDINQAL